MLFQLPVRVFWELRHFWTYFYSISFLFLFIFLYSLLSNFGFNLKPDLEIKISQASYRFTTRLLKLTYIVTKRVLFSFNNTMYQQIDKISMECLIGAALANIFVGFQEARLFEITIMPLFYKRYIDDTFVIFSSRSESRLFFHTIIGLYTPKI